MKKIVLTFALLFGFLFFNNFSVHAASLPVANYTVDNTFVPLRFSTYPTVAYVNMKEPSGDNINVYTSSMENPLSRKLYILYDSVAKVYHLRSLTSPSSISFVFTGVTDSYKQFMFKQSTSLCWYANDFGRNTNIAMDRPECYTNLPIFNTSEQASAYFLNNDFSAILNKEPVLSEATYDSTVDLKNCKWSMLTKQLTLQTGETITWQYDNAIDGSFICIEVEGTLYRTMYATLLGGKIIGGDPVTGKAYCWNVKDNLLANSKILSYQHTNIRERFAKGLGIGTDKLYLLHYKTIYITRYAMIDGSLKRSAVCRIEVKDMGTSSITYDTGTPDSTSNDYTKDENASSGSNDLWGEDISDGDQSVSDLKDSDMLGTFTNLIKGMSEMLGQFPMLLASIFAYLPVYIWSIIALGFILIIIMRIIGR